MIRRPDPSVAVAAISGLQALRQFHNWLEMMGLQISSDRFREILARVRSQFFTRCGKK